MKEQFVTFDIALKLKELGFNKPCMGLYYIKDKEFVKTNYSSSNNIITNDIIVDAPLWQQAIEWIREKYNYHISTYRLNNKWCGDVYDILRQCYVTTSAFDGITFNKYEESRESAILKALELINRNQK